MTKLTVRFVPEKRRAHIYTIKATYRGIVESDTTLSVYPKRYTDDTMRAIVTTPVYPVYISRREAAEFLLAVRARSRGAIEGLTVSYKRTTDYLI